MTAGLRHVNPGEPFKPKASDWNTFVDTARTVGAARQIFRPGDLLPPNPDDSADTLTSTGGRACGCCDCFDCIDPSRATIRCESCYGGFAAARYTVDFGAWVGFTDLSQVQTFKPTCTNCLYATDPVSITVGDETGIYQWVRDLAAHTTTLTWLSGDDPILQGGLYAMVYKDIDANPSCLCAVKAKAVEPGYFYNPDGLNCEICIVPVASEPPPCDGETACMTFGLGGVVYRSVFISCYSGFGMTFADNVRYLHGCAELEGNVTCTGGNLVFTNPANPSESVVYDGICLVCAENLTVTKNTGSTWTAAYDSFPTSIQIRAELCSDVPDCDNPVGRCCYTDGDGNHCVDGVTEGVCSLLGSNVCWNVTIDGDITCATPDIGGCTNCNVSSSSSSSSSSPSSSSSSSPSSSSSSSSSSTPCSGGPCGWTWSGTAWSQTSGTCVGCTCPTPDFFFAPGTNIGATTSTACA